MFDDDLRTLLRERADEVHLPPRVPPEVLRRARRGRRLVGFGAGLLAVVFLAGAVTGVRILSTPEPRVPLGPTPGPERTESRSPKWRAIWPERTREEGLAAQAAADRGLLAWRLKGTEVARAFARTELGWDEIVFEDGAGGRSRLRREVRVYSCDPAPGGSCAAARSPETAVVTIQRLVRRDRAGVWFVTAVAGPEPFEPRVVPADFPDTFVALQRLEGGDPVGRIVLVDVRTGEVVRTIVQQVGTSEGLGDLTISPTGDTLYYTQGTSACTNEIHLVAMTGGEPEVFIQDASNPAFTADGRRLAYVAGVTGGCPGRQELVVRDLVTGNEDRWELGYETGAGAYGVCELAWLPDGRRLAFSDCAEEGDELRLLDVEADRGMVLRDARRLGPEGVPLSLAGFHAPSGGIAARRLCPHQQAVADECPDPPSLISVDPDTGEATATLLELPAEVFSMTLDGSATYLIYGGVEGEVRGWSQGSDPVLIAVGYEEPSW